MSKHSDKFKQPEGGTPMSRFSFISSLGLLGGLSFFASSCAKSKPVLISYEGDAQDAMLHAIVTRRSIRKYTEQQVAEEVIDKLMRCAIHAPSAINAQPWGVRVIQNQEILNEISKRHFNFLRESGKSVPQADSYSAIYGAPTFIVIARDVTGRGTLPTFLDSGIILQTILLAAQALNLGTCTLGGLVPFLNQKGNADLLRLIKIPDDNEVAITISLGYPDEEVETPVRYADKVKIIK